VLVYLAAQTPNLALQGRGSLLDPPPAPPPPGFGTFASIDELAVEVELDVIRDVLPKLLYEIGYRDPEGIGPTSGMPSLKDVVLGLSWGQHKLDALTRATENLEALARRIAPPPAPPAAPPPREKEPADPNASGIVTPEAPAELPHRDNDRPAIASGTTTLDPAARAVAAAYALRKEGKPVSVRAACKAAGVDRSNLIARHPETVRLIEQLAEPDREPPSGKHDRRTENLDAWDDPDDD